MTIWLKMKHWQLFGILMVPQFIYKLILISTINSDPISYAPISIYQVVLAALSGAVYFNWLWSLVTRTYSILPEKIRRNILPFKISFGVLISYIGGMGIYTLIRRDADVEISPYLHLTAIFSLIFSIFQASKFWATLKLNRIPKTKDLVADFLLMIVFPIGVWLLQPRINEAFSSAASASSEARK